MHIIKPDIIHLMRGQVFELDGRTIFTFGGATSIDRHMRREGVSWWKEEAPTFAELDEGIANLRRPLRTRDMRMEVYPENRMLSYFEDVSEFGHWYFGHYHLDGRLNDRMTVLYNEVVLLGE